MRQFRVVVNGNEYKVAIEELAEETGVVERVTVPPQSASPAANSTKAKTATQPSPVKKESPGTGEGSIVAAMPGTILDIKVTAGDAVTKGQPLLILEAMKMENDVMAPFDGVVKEIYTTKGASVNSGDPLMLLV
jgi:glutaconyl-CoA/methylmalonyl-CoA decarboxylase subunit gamma